MKKSPFKGNQKDKDRIEIEDSWMPMELNPKFLQKLELQRAKDIDTSHDPEIEVACSKDIEELPPASAAIKDHFCEQLVRNAEACGFKELRTVQRRILPFINAKNNIYLTATGRSGKTIGYLLPLIQKVYDDLRITPHTRCCPRALIIVPSKEHAKYLLNTVRALTADMNIHSALSVSQMGVGFIHARDNADIIISTAFVHVNCIRNERYTMAGLKFMVVEMIDDLGKQVNAFLADFCTDEMFATYKELAMNAQLVLCSTDQATLKDPYWEECIAKLERVVAFKNHEEQWISPSNHLLVRVRESFMFESVLETIRSCEEGPTMIVVAKNEKEGHPYCLDLSKFLNDNNISNIYYHTRWPMSKREGILHDFCTGKFQVLIVKYCMQMKSIWAPGMRQVIHIGAPNVAEEMYETSYHYSSSAIAFNACARSVLLLDVDDDTQCGRNVWDVTRIIRKCHTAVGWHRNHLPKWAMSCQSKKTSWNPSDKKEADELNDLLTYKPNMKVKKGYRQNANFSGEKQSNLRNFNNVPERNNREYTDQQGYYERQEEEEYYDTRSNSRQPPVEQYENGDYPQEEEFYHPQKTNRSKNKNQDLRYDQQNDYKEDYRHHDSRPSSHYHAQDARWEMPNNDYQEDYRHQDSSPNSRYQPQDARQKQPKKFYQEDYFEHDFRSNSRCQTQKVGYENPSGDVRAQGGSKVTYRNSAPTPSYKEERKPENRFQEEPRSESRFQSQDVRSNKPPMDRGSSAPSYHEDREDRRSNNRFYAQDVRYEKLAVNSIPPSLNQESDEDEASFGQGNQYLRASQRSSENFRDDRQDRNKSDEREDENYDDADYHTACRVQGSQNDRRTDYGSERRGRREEDYGYERKERRGEDYGSDRRNRRDYGRDQRDYRNDEENDNYDQGYCNPRQDQYPSNRQGPQNNCQTRPEPFRQRMESDCYSQSSGKQDSRDLVFTRSGNSRRSERGQGRWNPKEMELDSPREYDDYYDNRDQVNSRLSNRFDNMKVQDEDYHREENYSRNDRGDRRQDDYRSQDNNRRSYNPRGQQYGSNENRRSYRREEAPANMNRRQTGDWNQRNNSRQGDLEDQSWKKPIDEGNSYNSRGSQQPREEGNWSGMSYNERNKCYRGNRNPPQDRRQQPNRDWQQGSSRQDRFPLGGGGNRFAEQSRMDREKKEERKSQNWVDNQEDWGQEEEKKAGGRRRSQPEDPEDQHSGDDRGNEKKEDDWASPKETKSQDWGVEENWGGEKESGRKKKEDCSEEETFAVHPVIAANGGVTSTNNPVSKKAYQKRTRAEIIKAIQEKRDRRRATLAANAAARRMGLAPDRDETPILGEDSDDGLSMW